VVSGDHESRGGELGEARVAQPREVLEGERGQVVPALAGSGQQYACFDPRVGQILGLGVAVGDAEAEQDACGLSAERVACRRDPVPVETAGEAGDGGFEGVEFVENALVVVDARSPQPVAVRVVLRQPAGLGIEVSGQDYYEAVSCPEVGQRRP
jgi:hypothetical protein